MYERETRFIHVAVKPAYLDDQSDPDDRRYVWSYTVTIENRGPEPVQLMSRYWNITDGIGRVKEITIIDPPYRQMFADTVLKSVRDWRFSPYLNESGQAEEVVHEMQFNFQLH